MNSNKGGPRSGAAPKSRSGAEASKTGRALYAGINTIQRIDNSSIIGTLSNFDTSNRFRYYQQLTWVSPHVSVSLNKLGLSLIKGMTFDSKNSRLVTDFNLWAKRVNFIEQVQTMAKLLCRDGIYISNTVGQNADTYSFYPLLMSQTTLLPDSVAPGGNATEVMKPPVSKFVVNEALSGQAVLNPDEVVYAAYNAWDYVQTDIRGRETWGLYGASLLDPIELSIRNLLNINQGYVSFVKKYGLGRYLIDFKLLEKLVEAGLLDIDDAQAAVDDFNSKHKFLSENEDISAFGLAINPIDAKGSLEVQEFKNSLETDIALGLLQSPLTMGKTEGSTYAAGYVSEADRLLVLEGLQKICENVVGEMINRRLAAMKKTPDSVWITFEELSQPQITVSEMQEMYNTGVISQEMFLRRTGFNVEDLDSEVSE